MNHRPWFEVKPDGRYRPFSAVMTMVGGIEGRWYANLHAFRTELPRTPIVGGMGDDTDRKRKDYEYGKHVADSQCKDRQISRHLHIYIKFTRSNPPNRERGRGSCLQRSYFRQDKTH